VGCVEYVIGPVQQWRHQLAFVKNTVGNGPVYGQRMPSPGFCEAEVQPIRITSEKYQNYFYFRMLIELIDFR